MKKLLLLGGSRYALPIIEAAHSMGCYVITCDYLPENVAHRYSDEYCNVSIVDERAVLEAAKNLAIDGIMSFACDPGVVTAAYVAEKLNLPTCGPYESVRILQNKKMFREFLKRQGFCVPFAKGYKRVEEALKEWDLFRWPVIVKPVDSAGSKGVTKVDDPGMLEKCIQYALKFSKSNGFIIENFLESKYHPSDSECFSVNGELKFVSYSAQRFDVSCENPYAPAAFSWQPTISVRHRKELTDELQRLLHLLDMGTSLYNVETRECIDGKAYIMECSPRGGGNRLSEMIRYGFGVDLISNAVRFALGEPLEDLEQKEIDGYWAEMILHSDKSGKYGDIYVADEIRHNIIEQDIWVEKGEQINSFSGADKAIGTLVLKFSTEMEMNRVLDNQKSYVKVIVDNN